MSAATIIFFCAAGLCAAAILIFSAKSGHFLRCALLSVLSGVGALFAVNILSRFTGVCIPVNWISLPVSAVFSLPGVIALILSQLV
ncbi:MAG: pro-sigmaK processing inhibitor BofA family protein [Acutalibacteraceae bacterium]